jgi:hypothetical protein
MIEDLRSMRDLRADFVFFCELADVDPERVRQGVQEKTGVSLDDMIDKLRRVYRELAEREYRSKEVCGGRLDA